MRLNVMVRMTGLILVGLVLIQVMPKAAPGQVDPKIQALCGGDEDLAKLDSSLLQMTNTLKTTKSTPEEVMFKLTPHAIRESNKLQCVIGVTELSPALIQACTDAGLQVRSTHSFPGVNTIVVWCSDPRDLAALAHRPDVRGIATESPYETRVGRVTSQADASIHTDQARKELGVTGKGVRVGVISDSMSDTRAGTISRGYLKNCRDQITGDLPNSIRMIDAGPGGGTDEGNGMAQLIYDLAPGCEISFASAASGYNEFAENITKLRTDKEAPAHIIVDDVGYFAEPLYQNGPISIAANKAVQAGVPYYSSAGNDADNAHEAVFEDVSPTDDETYPPTGVDLHDFGAAKGFASDTHLTIQAPYGYASVRAILKWDEPYGGVYGAGNGSEADLDLYLVQDTDVPLTDENILAQSTSVQGREGTPKGEPFELLGATLVSDEAQTYHLVINHAKGRKPVLFNLMVDVYTGLSDPFATPDSEYLGDRTIYGHPSAEKVMGVAAIYYREIDTAGQYQPPRSAIDVESFSSKGGITPFYFPDIGYPRRGTPLTVYKPDLTGPDGTDTTFFGSDDSDGTGWPNFFGTSASAPHLAAVAALMKSANHTLTPDQINDRLREGWSGQCPGRHEGCLPDSHFYTHRYPDTHHHPDTHDHLHAHDYPHSHSH